MGSGMAVPCDRLPFILRECECCGFIPHMFRGFTWMNKKYLGGNHPRALVGSDECRLTVHCDCVKIGLNCPICLPSNQEQERYGFMWVSKYSYTPESFIREAQEMEVSKRVNRLPKGLKPGMWILLAYKWVPVSAREYPEFQVEGKKLNSEPVEVPAIFYAFRLQRVEYLIWESEATPEYLEELNEKGLTPVVIPDGDDDHKSLVRKK